ncbi:MAG TPA: hypothetical protein PLS67_05895 [Accumulibacter sp.]|nr:hypothetical protein [Accumulibacter sp.]
MSKTAKILVTLLLLVVFAGSLALAWREQRATAESRPPGAASTPLEGVIAVDVEPFFQDGRVRKILAAHRLPVQVLRMGSRDMPGKVATGTPPDFLFASGVVAANEIVETARKANIAVTQVAPFHTPLVVASWEPIAGILVANGLAAPMQPRVYSLNMAGLTETMLAKKRWRDLRQANAYEVSRAVLVSTTDVRRSNSAAMYLALTGYALTGEIIDNRATARATAARLAELFKRQGFQENYVNGNFDDYVAIGIGKAPLAFIYENQLVSHAMTKKGISADMALLYPKPTIVNKVVFVATNERAKALGELLASNAELQGIAIDHGFRTADTDRFVNAVKPTGLAVQPRIVDVVDPPSAGVMAEMIDVVSKEMTQ